MTYTEASGQGLSYPDSTLPHSSQTCPLQHQTIDAVLERGVKLDDLVERSDDLSKASKMFYKQAKKTNSCCVIC